MGKKQQLGLREVTCSRAYHHWKIQQWGLCSKLASLPAPSCKGVVPKEIPQINKERVTGRRLPGNTHFQAPASVFKHITNMAWEDMTGTRSICHLPSPLNFVDGRQSTGCASGYWEQLQSITSKEGEVMASQALWLPWRPVGQLFFRTMDSGLPDEPGRVESSRKPRHRF